MTPTAKTTNLKLTVFNAEQKAKKPCSGLPVVLSVPYERPDLKTKIGRLRRDLAIWIKNGAPLATKAVRQARLATCRACEYYLASGNLGLGECRYPGCGCTRAKAALATSMCPAGKWQA
jgi:hypothetical protein